MVAMVWAVSGGSWTDPSFYELLSDDMIDMIKIPIARGYRK